MMILEAAGQMERICRKTGRDPRERDADNKREVRPEGSCEERASIPLSAGCMPVGRYHLSSPIGVENLAF